MKKIIINLLLLSLLISIGNADKSNVLDERLGKEIHIAAGDYYVGSDKVKDEKPMRIMHIEAFSLDIHAVTNIQYVNFLEKSSYTTEGPFDWNKAKTQPLHPATNVTYKDAQAYAVFHGKRLPTEWEWEIAARSLKKENAYVWGKNPEPDKCNWLSDINNPKMTTPVFQYEPNELGFYDMAGNVFEWTSSTYPEEFLKGKNASQYTVMVLKGGSWTNIIYDITVSARVPFPANRSLEWIGFRCAK
ncbi:MAG: hypothetical protein A2Y62_15505 [Candidatus Fischerbacteria bacterium RBG_13_37_8]|uniref:Sulfatase-modifying factor enzyme-like domain-containing protein n=1 Tax=Candidatus Fischerbacteria bacterium RBG_13_37_8 TaxID=1817863 RepID=A0A1F5VKZ8_9BACT|nr:MAG: hypothetical protein A2Y62_15505 [Candidatus Fischerbacteria bacterium RBG_13_37_8]